MKTITWKLHLKASTRSVFELLTTSEGRMRFWAEKSVQHGDRIHFYFPNGQIYNGRIIKSVPNSEFHLDYFHSMVKFKLEITDKGGTDLTLINEDITDNDFSEVYAGWISVLMNLKAVADFHCDLRNHDPEKTWDQGYVDN